MSNCITKHIPNSLTCCNLLSGCIAVTFAFAGDYPMAFLAIVIGAVFDFFDGMSARLLGVSSPIGKELDSLADDVTFGVAPASMVFNLLYTLEYPTFLTPVAWLLPYLAFLMAAFAALRLAKFNLDERQTSSFIGLPTPANALFWASLIVGGEDFLASSPLITLGVLALVFVCCWLQVAEFPMFALKFKSWGWKGNEVKYIFIIVSVVLLAVFRLSGFSVVIAWYVILSYLNNLHTGK